MPASMKWRHLDNLPLNLVSKHQVQLENGDEQADAGQD